MKKKSKKKKSKLVKKIDKKKIIFALVLLVVVYFLFKPKKDKLQDWEEIWGISPEANPDDLSFEEWNKLQPEVYRQEPGMLEYLRDCPFYRADVKDPYSMDIFIPTVTKIDQSDGCDREKHVEITSIIIQNHDFEKGVKEFKAWLKKNKLKLGKDVFVEDFYPWDYEKACVSNEYTAKSIVDESACLKDLKIECIVDEDHSVYEEFIFTVKKSSNLDQCKKENETINFSPSRKIKYTFIQEK